MASWLFCLLWVASSVSLTGSSMENNPIGHSRVALNLSFKTNLSAKSLLWKSVFNHIEIRTNYHNKNFALGLALKERLRGTRKWLIVVWWKWLKGCSGSLHQRPLLRSLHFGFETKLINNERPLLRSLHLGFETRLINNERPLLRSLHFGFETRLINNERPLLRSLHFGF